MKNILTRVLAVIMFGLGAVIIFGIWYRGLYILTTLIVLFFLWIATGFTQIAFSIVRWKKLTIADKIIFFIILTLFLFLFFITVSRFTEWRIIL